MTEKQLDDATNLLRKIIYEVQDKRGGRHVLLCACLEEYICYLNSVYYGDGYRF